MTTTKKFIEDETFNLISVTDLESGIHYMLSKYESNEVDIKNLSAILTGIINELEDTRKAIKDLIGGK